MAEKKVYFDDVKEGDEIPSLVKGPITKEQIANYADSSGDYNPIHVNEEFGKKAGLGGVIGHGLLSYGFLGQMMTDWLPKPTDLKKLGVRFSSIVKPGDTITNKGKITKKYEKEGECYVECEVFAENQRGEKTVVGTAVATLPSRGK
jgi:acyl dehydratase